MMKNVLIVTFLISLCTDLGAQDDLCIELMKPEVKMVGLFQRIDDFHHGLIFECREPNKEPYATLERLHPILEKSKSDVISVRGKICLVMDSLHKDGGKKALAMRVSIFEDTKKELDVLAKIYMGHGKVYDSLCTAHNIQMITHRQYADSLMERLLAWQDTLMTQGSQISRCNQELKANGLEKSSDEYRSRYQNISQMQLIHKEFQSKLMQVENQQSRYASARQDEVFYLGPYLVERHDVQSSEGFFDDLREMQDRFQNHRDDFRIQNSP